MRTKTVYSSSELAHVWAHQGVPYGRRSDDYMHFEGPAFYSYRTVIARIISYRGKQAFVVDSARFSDSTSKHQSHVRHATHGQVFYVNIGGWNQDLSFTAASLRDHYLSEYKRVGKGARSRYSWIRAADKIRRFDAICDARNVCRYFGLKHDDLNDRIARLMPEIDECKTICQTHADKRQARRSAKWSMRHARLQEQERVCREKAIEDAETAVQTGVLPERCYGRWSFGYEDTYLDGRPDLKAGIQLLREKASAQERADWIAGKPNVQPSYSWPVLLRAEGGEMVTSKGARVPLSDAERAYKVAMRIRSQMSSQLTETDRPIGMYKLDAVNEFGVIAGCHRVQWSEIDRFAGVMGWA